MAAAAFTKMQSLGNDFVMLDNISTQLPLEPDIIRHLADHHRNLCVVGDPDQSIYKWRGADLRNIMDFEQDFSEAAVVRLEQNYRSTQVILDGASALIRQNRNRKEKRLWTDRTGGAPIRYFRGGDELEEADNVLIYVWRQGNRKFIMIAEEPGDE